MKGAIVFLAAFLLFLVITFGYSDLPPGKAIFNAIVGPEAQDSTYEVLGMPVSNLSAAIFNGVIYGVIAYIAYTLIDRFFLSEKSATLKVKNV